MKCQINQCPLQTKNQLIRVMDRMIRTEEFGDENYFNLNLIKINNVATFMVRICLYTD